MKVIGFSLVLSLLALNVQAAEISPMPQDDSDEGRAAELAYSVDKVLNFRAGGIAYRVSWMDTILNGDLNQTVTVLVSENCIGGGCGYDAAFKIAPTDEAFNVNQVRVKNGQVYLELFNNDLETTSWIKIKYSPATGKLSSVKSAKP
jgi:hypothetical protein